MSGGGILADLEQLESRIRGLVDVLKKVMHDRVEVARQDGSCSAGMCNELQSIIDRWTLKSKHEREQEEAIREMLKGVGYVQLAYDDLIIPLKESACEWCKEKYGLTGDEHVLVVYFSQDELDGDREYITSGAFQQVDDLRELVVQHPNESCYFVEAQLFSKVYDNEDDELMRKILARQFHSKFHMKRIAFLQIANNQYPKQYRALSPFTFEPISFVMEMSTTAEQLHRYVDYFMSARQGRQIEGMRPVKIYTNASIYYDDQTRIYLHLSQDLQEVMILTANRFSMKGPHSNYRDEDCYHAGCRIRHTMMLVKSMNRYYDLILDLNFSECVCDCPNAPELPMYPKTETKIYRGKMCC